jgi:probable addiction module antidote protein
MMPKTTRFDAADYLDSEERQAAYITAALETGDADFVRDALGIVARARHGRDCKECRLEPGELV